MLFSAGERLGPYEILSSLGEGGMGQVFRARDTRLQREVAIKVSADQFSERFAREAQLIASLNHPNICTLYDVGPNYLVMELIEGPTLFDRIAAGPIPETEAIALAIQIAEALEAAHDKGIIHRDLKPANIKLTADGKVKVLDFGLAKALESDNPPPSQANSPTLAPTRVAGTQAGFILGTAGYMAPEQARGHAVDRRADVFAFGIVLWEMTTGRRMFDGETVSDTLAQILTQKPDIQAAPPALRNLLERCLEKDRRKRLQAIGEARIALEAPPAPTPSAIPAAAARPSPLFQITTAVAVVALIAAGAFIYRLTHPPLAPLMALEVNIGAEQPVIGMAGPSTIISPDGRRIATLDSKHQLWTRSLDQPTATMLYASPLLMGLFFSPDGQWIGFGADGKMKKVLVSGGPPIDIANVPNGNIRGAHWTTDGFIYYSVGTDPGVRRIPASGGEPALVTKLDETREESSHYWPHVLPNGKALLFSSTTKRDDWERASVELQRLDNGVRQTLVRGGSFARYLPSGHILYAKQTTLFALPFDLDNLQVKGPAVPVLEGVQFLSSMGYSQYHFSQTGTLVFRRGVAATQILSWVTSAGQSAAFLKPANYDRPGTWSLSPDGKRVAVVLSGSIWIHDFASDRDSRLTFEGDGDDFPVWCPDGSCIVFRHGRQGIWWVPASGAGKAQPLVATDSIVFPQSFLPGGRELLAGFRGIHLKIPIQFSNQQPIAGKPESMATGSSYKVSPDGRWAAYIADRTVFVTSWPDMQAKYQIATTANSPAWSPVARELLYREESNRVMAVPFEIQAGAFVPGKPRVWSEVRLAIGLGSFSIAPDGKRLLTNTDQSGAQAHNTVFFHFNFFDDLKRRLP